MDVFALSYISQSRLENIILCWQTACLFTRADLMEENVRTVYCRSATILPGQVKDNLTGEFLGSSKQRRSRRAIEQALVKLKSRHTTTLVRESEAVGAAIQKFRFQGGPYEKITKKRAQLNSRMLKDPDFYNYIQENPVRLDVSDPNFEKKTFHLQLALKHPMRVSIKPFTSQPPTAQFTTAARSDALYRILQLVTKMCASLGFSYVDLQPALSFSPNTTEEDDSETAEYTIHALEAILRSLDIQRAKQRSAEGEHEPLHAETELHQRFTKSREDLVTSLKKALDTMDTLNEALDTMRTSVKEPFPIRRNDPETFRAIVSSSYLFRKFIGPMCLTVLINIQEAMNPPHHNILPSSHRRRRRLKPLFSCEICHWQHPALKTLREHEERCRLGENQHKCGNRDKGCKFSTFSRVNIREHERNTCKFDARRQQPLGQ